MPSILYCDLILPLHTFQGKRTPQQFFYFVLNGSQWKNNPKNQRKDIPVKTIEVKIESTRIVQEEPVFFDTTDQQEAAEKELWKRLEEARIAIPNNPPVITVSCYYSNDLHIFTTTVNIAQFYITIIYTHRTRFRSNITKFKTRNVGTTIWRKKLQSDITIITWNSWQAPRQFKIDAKNSTWSFNSLQLQHTSETGFVIVKYAFKINA